MLGSAHAASFCASSQRVFAVPPLSRGIVAGDSRKRTPADARRAPRGRAARKECGARAPSMVCGCWDAWEPCSFRASSLLSCRPCGVATEHSRSRPSGGVRRVPRPLVGRGSLAEPARLRERAVAAPGTPFVGPVRGLPVGTGPAVRALVVAAARKDRDAARGCRRDRRGAAGRREASAARAPVAPSRELATAAVLRWAPTPARPRTGTPGHPAAEGGRTWEVRVSVEVIVLPRGSGRAAGPPPVRGFVARERVPRGLRSRRPARRPGRRAARLRRTIRSTPPGQRRAGRGWRGRRGGPRT